MVVKKGSLQAYEIGLRVASAARRLGVEAVFERSGVEDMRPRDTGLFELGGEVPERLVIVGGDGTLLRTLHHIGGEPPLIMTVRAGRRGFFFDVEPYEVEERFEDFVRGRFKVFEYERLAATVGGEALPLALNEDAVLAREGKIIRITVYRDDEKIYSLDGDGLIIATTAGSTAYALSAGGPIVDPGLQAIVIAPLNPIQLHLRPVVLPLDAEVRVEIRSGSPVARVLSDGQTGVEAGPGVEVDVRRAYSPVRIARFRVEGFYERLFTRVFQYW